VSKKICFLLIIFQLCLLPVYAGDYTALSKLGRGLVNFSLGWLEIPRQMVKVKEEGKPGLTGEIAGAFLGTLRGVTYFAGRMVVGVYEVGTFLIPSYKPLVEPEYIFSDDDGDDIDDE